MHGIMHLARELMLNATVKAPLAVVRSTLIYGEGDPHNGYGPNRFRRLAAAGQEIVLFGEGEERRDHVLIDDAGGGEKYQQLWGWRSLPPAGVTPRGTH